MCRLGKAVRNGCFFISKCFVYLSMKKLIIISLLFVSCKKEDPCNCGQIVSDNASDYSVTIQNECSGNLKTFILAPSDWATAYVGTNYCITNSKKW